MYVHLAEGGGDKAHQHNQAPPTFDTLLIEDLDLQTITYKGRSRLGVEPGIHPHCLHACKLTFAPADARMHSHFHHNIHTYGGGGAPA
jgi:hypothetical protein